MNRTSRRASAFTLRRKLVQQIKYGSTSHIGIELKLSEFINNIGKSFVGSFLGGYKQMSISVTEFNKLLSGEYK